jgi:cysteine synthase A
VELRKFDPSLGFRLLAKLESLNSGGSIKDRPALEILQAALQSGEIGLDTVIVESSSGNMGIGLAQACAYHGLRLICVVDVKASSQNVRILEAYGATVDVVHAPDPETLLPARLARVRQILAEVGDAFWPNRYANQLNSGAHFRTTMHEVATALHGQVDYLLCATSTCGTVRGCSEYVRGHGLSTRVVAVDAVGSLIFANERGPRHLPGMGAGVLPPLCDPQYIDEVVHVSDLECIAGCRRLVRREGILAGASSGGLVAAVKKIENRIPAGSTFVLILPDRGERYLDTVYCDAWVQDHFGEVGDLWPARD